MLKSLEPIDKLKIEVETPVSPSKVDMNRFLLSRENKSSKSAHTFKPTFKKLISPKFERIRETPQLEPIQQNRFYYVKSFSFVRTPSAQSATEFQVFDPTANSVRMLAKKREKKDNLAQDLTSTLKFFKENKTKYKPLSMKELPVETNENDSALEDLGFMTAVNIEEPKRRKKMELDISDIRQSELISDKKTIFTDLKTGTENITEQSQNEQEDENNIKQDDDNMSHTTFSGLSRSKVSQIRQTRSQHRLPSLQGLPSIAEERAERIKWKKPKIYISAKQHAVQPLGKPESQLEHLARVFNKEGTPVAHHFFMSTLGKQMDSKQRIYQSYLQNYAGQDVPQYFYQGPIIEEQIPSESVTNARNSTRKNSRNPTPGGLQINSELNSQQVV